ncbi:MAG: restriction endonuclease subunit S [Phycisphaerales bacterium]|nr:restriction endonuclease subunit S [Phycisphaerales bacterium]
MIATSSAIPIGSGVREIETWSPMSADLASEFEYIDIAAIDREQKVITATARTRASDAPSRARQIVQRGDVLVSTVRPALNAVAVVPASLDGAIASTGFTVLRSDERRLHGPYLFHWVRGTAFIDEMVRLATGASYPAVSDRIIKASCVPVPFPDDPRRSLAEQKRIAAILDKADAIRRRRQEAARLADTLIPSVFYEMFGDARTNRHEWPLRKFSEVCESRLGKMLDGKQQTGEHRRPYVGNANVQWFRFDLTNLKDMDFDEFDRAEFRLQAGDVLICEGGEVGRAAVWRDELPECYFQKAIHRARPYPKKATPEYIAWLMRDLAQHGGFDLVTSQATIAHLTGEKLKGLPIPVPPFPLQEQFSKKVRELEAFGTVQRSACAGLDDLFNALVQRAFCGEL